MSKKRYVSLIPGAREGVVKKAFDLMVEHCKEARLPGILLTYGKSNIASGILPDALGDDVISPLRRGRPALLPGNVLLEHKTERTFNPINSQGVILCFFPSDKMLDMIDSASQAEVVIVVSWLPEEVSDWVGTWQPEVIGGGEPPAPLTINNPVVEVSLKHLSASVNLSTGLNHPTDRSRAIELFKLLRRVGEDFDPSAVRAWAATHGWRPQDASELGDVAKDISEGKSRRKPESYKYRPGYISELRKEAGERS